MLDIFLLIWFTPFKKISLKGYNFMLFEFGDLKYILQKLSL